MAVCLITGGAGFLGSHLAEELLARGHAVRVFDDFSTGSLENLAGLEDRIDLVRGSVTDLAAVQEATAGVDYVFHLAAPPAGVRARPTRWRRRTPARPARCPSSLPPAMRTSSGCCTARVATSTGGPAVSPSAKTSRCSRCALTGSPS
jgi:hypothetical protein